MIIQRSSRSLVNFATTFDCGVACACTGNVAHLHVRANTACRQPFLLPVGYHAQNAYAYADWRLRYAPHIPTRDRFEPCLFHSKWIGRKSIRILRLKSKLIHVSAAEPTIIPKVFSIQVSPLRCTEKTAPF